TEVDIEYRRLVWRTLPPCDLSIQAESRCGERNRFEQRSNGYLARMTVEVVHALRSRVVAVDCNPVVRLDSKTPGLRIVSAWRPTGKVEYLGQRHHLPFGSAGCHPSFSRAQLSPRDGDSDALQRTAVPPRAPDSFQRAAIGVKLDRDRCSINLASLEHDFQRL